MKRFPMSLIARVQAAAHEDNTISVPLNELATVSGFSVEYLEGLGLRKADLKRLEVWGLARRGYDRQRTGWRTRWILINPTSA